MWRAPKNVYKHDNYTLNTPRKTNKNVTTWKLKSSKLKIRKKRSNFRGNDDKSQFRQTGPDCICIFGRTRLISKMAAPSITKQCPAYFEKNALIFALETSAWNCLELNLSGLMPHLNMKNTWDDAVRRVQQLQPGIALVKLGYQPMKPKMISHKTYLKRIQGPTILAGFCCALPLLVFVFGRPGTSDGKEVV